MNDRIKREMAFLDEVELLASVFESSLDAKLIFYSSGKIYRANLAAEKIFLKPGVKELEGRNILTLLSSKSRNSLSKFLERLKAEREIHDELEIRINGENKVFDVTGNAFIVRKLHLIILRDVTERVREKKSREQFIAIAGHELKTPLTVISVYTELLKKKFKDNRSLLIYLNKISGKTKLLTEYIDSILDEIRIGTGKFQFDDRVYKFDTIASTVLSELRRAYPESKIVFQSKTGRLINVDKERVSQVIRNLVVNAIKHSPQRKAILVESRVEMDNIYFSVTDRGKGISIQEQPLLFQAFYRGTDSKKQKSGLGLGLYLSKQIIKRYGGVIGVESKKGKGAKFFFELPSYKES